ncbi:inositol polyphosphate multikinase [Pelobates fuscus]|uniref:inositol polyphosphate multikinase n=1 Tax=Pelobates fuscus TaxID=191477 RepID=UPI002FE4CAC5
MAAPHHLTTDGPASLDLHSLGPADRTDLDLLHVKSRRSLNGCVPLSHQVAGHMYGKDKVGVSKFFYNGTSLRKDVVANCIQQVQSILAWFENQESLNFYASSLLFVYEGSPSQITKRLIDGSMVDHRVVQRGTLTDGELAECNNNIHVLCATENGKPEDSLEKNLSRRCGNQKKACSKRHHSQVSKEVESSDRDNTRKSRNNISQEHVNGNLIPKLENVFCHVPADLNPCSQVDVRMIDFAHVFPSNGKDTGYIYGLKNLIAVLQSILTE